MANSSPISSAQNQQQMQIGGGTNNGNEIVQHQILNEIQRFESVHPCIYRIYDLVEKIENDQIANLIRQQVISIEDAFVNSQEWTLSRMINEIRLVGGIIIAFLPIIIPSFDLGRDWVGGQLQKFANSLFPNAQLELGGCPGGWALQEGSHG
jgi:hypothetical protein